MNVSKTIPFARPLIEAEEISRIVKTLSSPVLVHGPMLEKFENDFSSFTKSPFSIAVSSCTAALHLAYVYLNLRPGDEVLVPAETHVATAHAVEFCGAKPVFIDSELKTGNLDLDQIEDKINKNTRALSLVHFLGMPVNMERVMQIAQKYDLFVVEDCALAIGSYFDNIHAGLHGDVGCFSFYPVKHFTTAEGGMLITRNKNMAQSIKRLRAFGLDRHVGERKVDGMYDVPILGYNYRLNELQSSLGIEQLAKVPSFLEKRKKNYILLQQQLRDVTEIDLLHSTEGRYQSSYYCLCVLLDGSLCSKRLELLHYLNEHGIGTSIYYPKPVPFMSYYRNKYSIPPTAFPMARTISERSICFPVGPHVDEESVHTIANTFKNAISYVRRT